MVNTLTPEILEEELRDIIRDIYLAFHKDAIRFNAYFLRLIDKSGPENRARLRSDFQLEVIAYEMWYNSPDKDEFFKKYLGDDYKEKYDDG